MIEGDDGNCYCYCLFADERYLDTPVVFVVISCLIKSRNFPLHCSFVWDAYGLIMMILRVLLWNQSRLALLNVSIYLSSWIMIQGGGRCVQSAVVTKSSKKLTNIGGWSIPKYCSPFSNEGIRKRKYEFNLKWVGKLQWLLLLWRIFCNNQKGIFHQFPVLLEKTSIKFLTKSFFLA